MTSIRVRLSMTTSHRSQDDGHNERQYLVVEKALRCMVSYYSTYWTELLECIEYAHATLVSASTGYSLFEIDTGRKERSPWKKLLQANGSQKEIAVQAKAFAETQKKIIDQARENLI